MDVGAVNDVWSRRRLPAARAAALYDTGQWSESRPLAGSVAAVAAKLLGVPSPHPHAASG